MRRHGWIFGQFLVTTGIQAQGAPVVDRAMASDDRDRYYDGRAVLLKPWKRGERSISARFLFVGRRRFA